MNILKKPSCHIPLTYFVLGALWIFFTDSIVHSITSNPELILQFQNMKGWLFVLLSSLLLFVLIHLHEKIHARQELKRKQVFHKTVEGSCHIILNYFNQMKLLHLEAEKHPGFDQEVLLQSNQITDEAIEVLRELDALSDIETDQIEALIYRKEK